MNPSHISLGFVPFPRTRYSGAIVGSWPRIRKDPTRTCGEARISNVGAPPLRCSRRALFSRKISRTKLLEFFARPPRSLMESGLGGFGAGYVGKSTPTGLELPLQRGGRVECRLQSLREFVWDQRSRNRWCVQPRQSCSCCYVVFGVKELVGTDGTRWQYSDSNAAVCHII
jgi:hypothetical protein